VHFQFQADRTQGQIKTQKNKKVTSWPQAQTAETAVALKTKVAGHNMETTSELVMIQIILFAPDPDYPFWFDSKYICTR